jgi:hypothetical protein
MKIFYSDSKHRRKKMIRPKSLYTYSDFKLERHRLASTCCPQFVTIDGYGSRWRCRSDDHDFYGYDSIASAKEEEVENTKSRIFKNQKWLDKLNSKG